MKKILISLMAIVLVIGLVGAGTFAFFYDTETSVSNGFKAGTLDLELDDANEPLGKAYDSVTQTWTLSDVAPGTAGTEAALSIHNKGNVAGDHVEFVIVNAMSDPVNEESDTVSGAFSEATGAPMDKYMVITRLDYTSPEVTNDLLAGPRYLGPYSPPTIPGDAIHVYDGGLIQTAVNTATVGGYIAVHAGTYPEKVTVNKSLTIVSVDGRGAADVTPTASGGPDARGFDVSANNVRITGFDVATNSGIGICLTNADNCIVEDNSVSSGESGIYLIQGSDGNIIGRNTVNVTYNLIWLDSSSNCVVEDNVCTSAGTGTGIALVDNFGAYSGNVVRHNLVSYTTLGIRLFNGADNFVENNVCHHTGNAIRIDAGYGRTSSGNVVKKNKVVDGTSAAIVAINWRFPSESPGTFSNIVVTENIIADNKAGVYITDTPFAGTTYPVDATAFAVNYNNIVNNEVYGAKNLGSGTLDARYNYWLSNGAKVGDVDDSNPNVGPCIGLVDDYNGNQNGWIDLDDFEIITGSDGLNIYPAPGAGGTTSLTTGVRFHHTADNGFQGDKVDMTMTVTLNQDSSQ